MRKARRTPTFSLAHWASAFWWMPSRSFVKHSATGWNATSLRRRQIEDVTDQFSLFHVLSEKSPTPEHSRIVSVRRFAEPGWDIWSDAALHDAVWQPLSSAIWICRSCCRRGYANRTGDPRWGSELTEEIIPIEGNLEQRTVDYEKGCYIGQEVISRIRMSGQTNKRLCGFDFPHDVPLQPGMKLAAPSAAGREVGWVTTATRSERIGRKSRSDT